MRQGVCHDTSWSKANWATMYFNIFWKSWNWPSYSRVCLLNWLCWYLVVETSSLTVESAQFALRQYLLGMWRHIGTRHGSCSSKPTDYVNSDASGSTFQTTVITGHSLQHRMNGPLPGTSWKLWGHSNIGPCGCQCGIWSDCITLSQTTMTCSIFWMVLCELWLRRRLNWRKTYSSLWRSCDRSCPIIMLKRLQQGLYFSFVHLSSILSRTYDCFGSGMKEWIWILRTRYPILPNSNRPFWSIWGMNTVPNIDMCRSIHPNAYRATISSPPK